MPKDADIGFAIPVDSVNRIVPELISKGRVPTPGIGIVAANEAVATRLPRWRLRRQGTHPTRIVDHVERVDYESVQRH